MHVKVDPNSVPFYFGYLFLLFVVVIRNKVGADRIRNAMIRDKVGVTPTEDKIREARL